MLSHLYNLHSCIDHRGLSIVQVSLLLDSDVEGPILNTGRDFDGQVAQSKHMYVWSNQTGRERKKKIFLPILNSIRNFGSELGLFAKPMSP